MSSRYYNGAFLAKAVAANPYRNNGGTVFYGGTITGSNPAITNSMGLSLLGVAPFVYNTGPKVSTTGGSTLGNVKALSTGNFAKMVAGQYVIFGSTNQLAGISNSILTFTSNRGQHPSRNAAALFIRTVQYVVTGGWYYVTGQPVARADSADPINAEVAPGTRALPGDITFMSTGKNATVQALSAKTG